MTKVYKALALAMQARLNCKRLHDTAGWMHKHTATILKIINDTAPSGSGIDQGTKINFDKSTGEILIFDVAYHHMNDGGMYDGWTQHDIKVTGSMQFDFLLKISGPSQNQIKDYLADVYSAWLNEEIKEV